MKRTMNRSVLAGYCLVVIGCPLAWGSGTDAMDTQSVDARIKPLGSVMMAAPDPTTAVSTAGSEPSASTDPKLGENTFNGLCSGCHGSGAMGAPKMGSKTDWAPRIARGIDSLYHSALNGKNAMPARGGNPSLSDSQVKAAVDYMVAAAK